MPVRPNAGRKSKYPDLAKKVIQHVKDYGFSRAKAALAVGTSLDSIARWEEEYPDFADSLKKAEFECEKFHLDKIRKAKTGAGEPDWKASAWFLARKWPDQYSEKIKHDVTANVSNKTYISLSPDDWDQVEQQEQQEKNGTAK